MAEAEKDYAERLAQATHARLSGEPLRFVVKRRHSALPGYVPVDERYPHLGTRETHVYGSIDWIVVDLHIAAFEVQSFASEDEANAAADVLNATRTSGADEIRQKIHPLNADDK